MYRYELFIIIIVAWLIIGAVYFLRNVVSNFYFKAHFVLACEIQNRRAICFPSDCVCYELVHPDEDVDDRVPHLAARNKQRRWQI